MIATARSASDAFDLRCELREKLIAYLQAELPGSLPRRRQDGVRCGSGSTTCVALGPFGANSENQRVDPNPKGHYEVADFTDIIEATI